MMTRRNFVCGLVIASMPGGFSVDRNQLHHEPSDAFHTIYNIFTQMNDWHERPIVLAMLEEMVVKAGFTVNVNNVLIDYKSNPVRIVTIYPNGEVEYVRNGKTEVYKDLDSAIFGIYGVQRIL